MAFSLAPTGERRERARAGGLARLTIASDRGPLLTQLGGRVWRARARFA